MRIFSTAAALLLCLGAACGPSVTGDDIDDEIEQELSSVQGAWHGSSNVLSMDFTLQQGVGTAVSGSGSAKETSAPSSVPITVTGTFSRPNLSLTFNGMSFEGHAVTGTFSGGYTTVGGISGTLHLEDDGLTWDIPFLLAED